MPRRRKTAPASTTVTKPANIQEIERIISSSIRSSDGIQIFRLRWKGFGAADDSWRTKEELAECGDLIEEFESSRIEALVGIVEGGEITQKKPMGMGGKGKKGHRRAVKSVSFCETVVMKSITDAGGNVIEQTFLRE